MISFEVRGSVNGFNDLWMTFDYFNEAQEVYDALRIDGVSCLGLYRSIKTENYYRSESIILDKC